jgi:3-oxoadipate enol-lactonase
MNLTAGGQTHYSDLGDGAPLVFVHALGLNTGMWSLQVPALAQRYRVIRYDVRGHGFSPYSGGAVSMASLADDLLELMEHLRLERPVVVGISMGGMVAQAFAAAHPERVFALVLASTVPVFGAEAREDLRERAQIVQTEGMEPMVTPAITRWFTGDFRERATANPLPHDAAEAQLSASEGHTAYEAGILGAIANMIRATEPAGYAAVCRALAEADLTRDLGKIACSALVMSGEEDPAVSPQSQETLLAGIRNSTPIIVADSSHLIPVERATEFNNNLLEFLSRCGYGRLLSAPGKGE